VSDLEGAPHDSFNSAGIIASNTLVHSEMLGLADPFRKAVAG